MYELRHSFIVFRNQEYTSGGFVDMTDQQIKPPITVSNFNATMTFQAVASFGAREVTYKFTAE